MPETNEVPTTEPQTETEPKKRNWKKAAVWVGGAIALLTAGAVISSKLKDSDVELEWEDIKEATTPELS